MKKQNNPEVNVKKKSGKNTNSSDSSYFKKTDSSQLYGFTSKKENVKKGTSVVKTNKSLDSLDSSKRNAMPYNTYSDNSYTVTRKSPKKESYTLISSKSDSKRGTSSDSSYTKTTRKPTERRAGKEVEKVYVRKNDQTSGSSSKTVKKLPKKSR
jgi:hypothetical protein